MDSRLEEPATNITTPRVPGPQGARRSTCRVAIWVGLALGVECLFIVAAVRLYPRYRAPRLPPPTHAPIVQAGGTLRQLLGPPIDAADWSSDGKRLLFTCDDSPQRLDLLAHTWDALNIVGAAPEIFPGTMWCLGVISADGTNPRVTRMPQGLNPLALRSRPGSSGIAVSTLSFRVKKGRAINEFGIWTFDLARGRLGKRLVVGPTRPESWSPDGRSVLYSVHGRFQELIQNRVVDAETGAIVDVPAPAKPQWMDRGQWSPDSRFSALRWHTYRPAKYKFQRWPCRGLWIADLKRMTARLISTGHIGLLCWLPDGRILLTQSVRTGENEASRMGVINPGGDHVAWSSRLLPGVCSDMQQACGRVVVRLVLLRCPRAGQPRAGKSNLWQVSPQDGSVRRLTKLQSLGYWELSPRGDKIALSGGPFSHNLPGVWILQLDSVRAGPDASRQGPADPATK